jgi:hypothetical protein
MPDSGTSAFDTYVWDAAIAKWRHTPNSLLHYAESGSGAIYRPPALDAAGNLTYLVYLPLRNAPAAINLTVPTTSALCGGASCGADAAPRLHARAPIVWYGTSIVQGGVAMRAGNAFSSLLGRALGREVLNLGFANNGVMELSVGALIADIAPAAAIVIDCLPNMNAALVTNRTAPLVRFLRAHGHPTTPIVLAEGTPTPADWLNASANPGAQSASDLRNAALRAEYAKLLAAGVVGLHYVEAGSLFRDRITPGPEGWEVNPTVCGVHSSDLGQYEIADFYAGWLPAVLNATDAEQR